MKHKRQTLSKQNDDGDDKDSISSDGAKSGKMSDKLLGDEMSKKSCQGCEMPPSGVCGPHDEVPDLNSSRGNNNNTPSATNNNTNFNNNNSNGASSIASSSSFDKIISEEDSQSNEDISARGSPRISKKGSNSSSTISIKTENHRNSPNVSERRVGLCKMSPNVNHKDNSILGTSSELTASNKITTKSMINSATPITPNSVLGITAGSSNSIYPHLQRSSPTTATAIASATVTIQNVSNSIPPFAARGAQLNNFQNQYQLNHQSDYRTESRSKSHQQYQHPNYTSNDMYNPDQVIVAESQTYYRNQVHPNAVPHDDPKEEMSLRTTARSRQSYQSPYGHQQNYFGYNKRHVENYQHNITNQSAGYGHGYQSENSGYNHYGYPVTNMYPNEGSNNINNHVPNAAHMNHGHETSANYYHGENMHQMHKVHNHSDYTNKVNYYENGAYNSSQMVAHTESSNYIPSEPFPNTNAPSSLVAASVMTPPASVQTDSSDTYNSFHQYYPGENAQTHVPPTGENSNSSSDFNFLSNLANDFTPEYYQI